jgi:hypothetical protein
MVAAAAVAVAGAAPREGLVGPLPRNAAGGLLQRGASAYVPRARVLPFAGGGWVWACA